MPKIKSNWKSGQWHDFIDVEDKMNITKSYTKMERFSEKKNLVRLNRGLG